MLAAALTKPAPMTVPATPKNEASTAAVIDANALAVTWMGLRWKERSRSFMVTAEGRSFMVTTEECSPLAKHIQH